MKKTKRKISIIGTSPTSLDDAPYNDQSWEIWQLNGCFKTPYRFDRHFEFHSVETLKRVYKNDYFNFLANNKEKVWTFNGSNYFDAKNRINPSVILDEFPGYYFSNTISWLLALAMHEGDIGKISIFGVDMDSESEYVNQRPCVEYYIGLAQGRGIDVSVSNKSSLLHYPYIYGVENTPRIVNRINRQLEIYSKVVKESENRFNENERNHYYNKGKLDMLKTIKNNWS